MVDHLKNLILNSLPEIIGGLVVAIVVTSTSALFVIVGIGGTLAILIGILFLFFLILFIYGKRKGNLYKQKTTSHQPSATAHVLERLQLLVNQLNTTPTDDAVLIERLVQDTFKGRTHLLRVITAYFDEILNTTKHNLNQSLCASIIQTAQSLQNIIKSAHQKIALSGARLLQQFIINDESRLVDSIILVDFSTPISQILLKLSEQYPNKKGIIKIFLIASDPYFISSQDTAKWQVLLGQLGFYHLEMVTSFGGSEQLFIRLNSQKKSNVLLLGAERIFPDGKIAVWPGMHALSDMAMRYHIPVVVVAECYKIQSLLEGESPNFGTNVKGEPTELTHLILSDHLSLLTDHAFHTNSRVNGINNYHHNTTNFFCCQRYWRNLIENKNYPIAVLFDLDGTLLDNELIHMDLYKEVAKIVGYNLSDNEYNSIARGRSDKEIISYCVEHSKLSHTYSLNELVNQKQQKYNSILKSNKITIKQGVCTYIKSLATNGFLIGLVTSATKKEATESLEYLNVLNHFSVIVSSELVPIGKPHPSIYREAARLINLSPAECLVYEDSLAGIQSAAGAGMTVIAVSSGLDTTTVIKAGAKSVILDFGGHQLPEIQSVS